MNQTTVRRTCRGEESPSITAFPGAEWETATPESEGVHPKRLEKALAYLSRRSGKDGISETVLIRNGRLLWQGENAAVAHNVWSCTKAFTSTVLGLLIDRGTCSLETFACEHLESLADMYPKVTLRHFATMTSGYNGGGDQSRFPFKPSEPLFAPGTEFRYWDSAMNQFLNVLTRIAGVPAQEIFRRSVADPIGIEPEAWQWKNFGRIDGLLVNGGAGNKGKGLHLSALDMARFGHLFLNRGEWGGKRLLSEEWVDLATSAQVSPAVPEDEKSAHDGPGRYGFGWWTNGTGRKGRPWWPSTLPGTYAARGFNNNRCFVLPEWKMVIVRQGRDGNIDEAVYDRFFRLLGEALTGCRL